MYIRLLNGAQGLRLFLYPSSSFYCRYSLSGGSFVVFDTSAFRGWWEGKSSPFLPSFVSSGPPFVLTRREDVFDFGCSVLVLRSGFSGLPCPPAEVPIVSPSRRDPLSLPLPRAEPSVGLPSGEPDLIEFSLWCRGCAASTLTRRASRLILRPGGLRMYLWCRRVVRPSPVPPSLRWLNSSYSL